MKSPSKRAVAAAMTGVVAAVGGLLTLLSRLVDDTSTKAPIQLELVRIALTILLGTGGLLGLYLAWRRQRSTEIALQQKERDQADVARAYELQKRSALAGEADAAARRITDLYTKAIEQLGSDKAPVRLGGFYALERLAQENPEQRQTIVNVLCAYLRMPYALPTELPTDSSDSRLIEDHRERTQEREVRLASQRVLVKHLHPGNDPDNTADTFWKNVDLDLTTATLINLELVGCSIKHATFRGATFTGDACFLGTTFAQSAIFDEATFTGEAEFISATFAETVSFNKVTFIGPASFADAIFGNAVGFEQAAFTDLAEFIRATFDRAAHFRMATFAETSNFSKVTFTGLAVFTLARFSRTSDFDEATFTEGSDFSGTTFVDGSAQA